MASPKTQQLVARASKVFPGGKYTRWPLMQTLYAPKFLERGDGCRVWDTDGKPYIVRSPRAACFARACWLCVSLGVDEGQLRVYWGRIRGLLANLARTSHPCSPPVRPSLPEYTPN